MNEILVYTQLNKNEICDFSYDLISYAKEISKNETVISSAIIANSDFILDENKKKNLYKFGADKVYLIKENFSYYDKYYFPDLIFETVKKINPSIVLFNSTTEGREIAPKTASKLNTGLTADCTGLEIIKKEDEFKLISTRPTFGGKLMASILSKTTPDMSTVRVNTFKKKEFNFEGEIEVIELNFEVNQNSSIKILEFIEDKKEFSTLENAKIIVSGGMGLKNKEGFEKLETFAKLINASIGATRKAVDKGLIDRKFQIGQTGKCATPEIYIAFGIKGAIHHIVGMENSKKIIAVNTDKNAPIFNYADFGIIKDANLVLDELISFLQKEKV